MIGGWAWGNGSVSLLYYCWLLPGCGTDEPTRLNTFTPLTSIVITSVVVTLPAGVSTQLTATGNFSGVFTRDITNQVAWSSDQPLTADFPADFPPGRIKAFIPGPTTIIASLDGVSSKGFALTVNDAVITTLTVAPLLPSLPLGLSQAFTAQGTFSDGITRDLTKDVTWSSSDVTVATISDDFASKGKATALKMGSTVIFAKFGTVLTESTTLTVIDATLSAIEVTPVNPSLLSLSTQAFTAMGKFSDGTSRDVTADAGITWVSSNPVVATITTDSIIKAQIPGLSTVKATLGTVSGTSFLKVTGGNLESIALTLPQAKNNLLFKGTVSRVTARGTFDNGTSRDITGAVTLADDSVNVSVTPASGNLAWVQAVDVTPPDTPAKIFATYGIIVPPGESLLTVTDPTLDVGGLSILEQTLTLASGTSGRLSLTGTFSSGSSQDLTPTAVWSSENPLTATVGNDGLEKGRVHAVTAGH